mgnify:CR=1 FL=1
MYWFVLAYSLQFAVASDLLLCYIADCFPFPLNSLTLRGFLQPRCRLRSAMYRSIVGAYSTSYKSACCLRSSPRSVVVNAGVSLSFGCSSAILLLFPITRLRIPCRFSLLVIVVCLFAVSRAVCCSLSLCVVAAINNDSRFTIPTTGKGCCQCVHRVHFVCLRSYAGDTTDYSVSYLHLSTDYASYSSADYYEDVGGEQEACFEAHSVTED